MPKRSRAPSAESVGSSADSRKKDEGEEYSYEYEEYTVSESDDDKGRKKDESDSADRGRGKDKVKKDKKDKKKDKKEKKKGKKEAKKAKKKEKKTSKKDKKAAKKTRKKSQSSDSRSPSPKRRRRGSSSSSGSARNGGYGMNYGGGYGGAAMYGYTPGGGLQLPGGVDLAEVCEKAANSEKGATVEDDDVTVEDPDGRKIRRPETFDEFDDIKDFPKELRSELKRFPRPSQVQAYTWPLLVDGKDMIGIAATGSGKTLAFLLPSFADMLDRDLRPEREGAGCLVLAPTRELAQQTEEEAEKFGRSLGLRVVAMYGGAPKGDQMSKYRRGVHTIVACPGRLNDFLESGQVRVDNCKKFVLDEADRMLDMGFEPQIRKILKEVPRNRHTMFFTATWPKEVRNLAEDILHQPYKVMIGNRQTLKGNQDITQVVQVVPAHAKQNIAFDLLRQAGATESRSDCKVLIFCQTKRGCEALCNDLRRFRVPAASIHGDKDQRDREQALNGLKRGDIKVLVATDVAARGLDIKGIGLVLNFDPANNNEDYVHRIGRTGRAGVQGFAITLLTHQDAGKARGIIDVMERTDQYVSPELRELSRSAGKGGGKGQMTRYAGGGFGARGFGLGPMGGGPMGHFEGI